MKFQQWGLVAALTPTPIPTPTPTPTPTPFYETVTAGEQVTTTTIVKATADANGRAIAAVPESQLSDAIAKAVAEAEKQGTKTLAGVRLEVTAPVNAKTVCIDLTVGALKKFIESNADALTVATPFGIMTLDTKAVAGIARQTAGTVTITGETKQAIGGRPVVSFDISSGEKTLAQLDAKAEVTLRYALQAGENPNAVIIYHVNVAGELETVANGKYDPVTGMITFKTPDISTYAIGYSKIDFADVAEDAWYGDAVIFAAARGITTGVGSGNFGSDETVTRAQALVMLMKAFGIAPDVSTENNFSDAGDSYYTGYLAAAKGLGISSGVGGNLFAPDRKVTRQEVLVLTYNLLKKIGELPGGTTARALQDFRDTEEVADYASEAMEHFVNTGIVSGSNGNLLPLKNASRAQFVQILYNLMTK